MQDLSSHGARKISSALLPQGWRGLRRSRRGLVGKAAMLAWGNYVEKLPAPDEASNVVDFQRVAAKRPETTDC